MALGQPAEEQERAEGEGRGDAERGRGADAAHDDAGEGGAAVKATVRASSARALARGRIPAGTSEGISAGAATWKAMVPQPPTNPSSASRGREATPLRVRAPEPSRPADTAKRELFADPPLLSIEVVLPDLENSLLVGTRIR